MNLHDRPVQHQPAARAEFPQASGAPAAAQPVQAAARSGLGLGLRALRLVLQILLPIAVIAVGYGGYQYLKATKPEPSKQRNVERAFGVRVVPVEIGTFQPELTLYGSAVAGREVDLRALVSGRVMETSPNLREGGVAEKGAKLLSIDPLDYKTSVAEARAQLSEARARIAEFKASRASDLASRDYARQQLTLAEADLSRALPLAKDGTVSGRTLDDRRQVVLQRKQAADQLSNALFVWDARISQQEAIVIRLESTIAQAEQRLKETDLTVPFDAYLTDVSAQVGRMVGVNDKVATLIDRNWIDARFTLTDQQYGRIVAAEGSLEGRKVQVNWKLGVNEFTYSAAIERVGARIATGSGGVELFARIEDPLNPIPLRPGAFLSVSLPDATFTDVIRLPATALYNSDTVYVVADGRLQTRRVTVASGSNSDILVRGDLKAGEKVLASRISTPGDGVLVREIDAP